MNDNLLEEERRKIRIAIEQKAVDDLRSHMSAEDIRTARESSWHIGKEIPLAVIFFLIVQTGSIIWWAASTSAEQRSQRELVLAAQIAQTAVDRRQDDAAQREESRLITQLDNLNNKMDRIIERVSK